MPSSKRNRFISRMLAILFLFLNCVSVASPAVDITANDYRHAGVSQPANDLNNPGSEENQLPAYSFKHHPVRISSTAANHACKENSYSTSSILPIKMGLAPGMNSSYFSPKPAYYNSLFRYKLF